MYCIIGAARGIWSSIELYTEKPIVYILIAATGSGNKSLRPSFYPMSHFYFKISYTTIFILEINLCSDFKVDENACTTLAMHFQ